MANLRLRQPLSLAVALMCMAVAANFSAAAKLRSSGGGGGAVAMMEKHLRERRNMNPAELQIGFSLLSKVQLIPPSGPSRRHNRLMQFTASSHVPAHLQTVPASPPSKRVYSSPPEFARGRLDLQVHSEGQTVAPSGPGRMQSGE